MTSLGFDHPLYILPFDHRGSFQKKMFRQGGELTSDQTAESAWLHRLCGRADIHLGSAGRLARKENNPGPAVAEIARRYREFVDIFESPQKVVAA